MLKKLTLLALGLLLFQNARAAITHSLPFYDAFNYPEGNLNAVSGGNWITGSGTITFEIAVSNSAALTSPFGLAAATGKGLRRAPSSTTRRSVLQYTSVPAVDGNAMYVSFLLNVQTAPGSAQIIGHLDDLTTSDGSPQAGIFLDAGPKVGIGKNASAPGFTMATNLGAGTHLVVVRYTFQSSNDKVDLWVDPASSGYGVGAAPASLGSTTNSTDPASLDYFQLVTSNDAGGSQFIDEFRLGTNWASVTPTSGTPPPPTNSTPVITNALLTIEGLALSGTNGMPNAFYRVLASPTLNAPQNSWPALATNTFDASGNFDDVNPVAPAVASQFYRLLSPGGGSPPTISAPLPDQTVVAGQNAIFSVSVTGDSPFGYQWYFNTNTVLANATNTTLTLTNLQGTNAGKYSVIVTNNGGYVTSVLATLTVNTGPTAPSITTQPQNQTVNVGQNAAFNITASGSLPLHYQWYFNTNTLLSGYTNTSLTVTNAQTNNAGAYSIIVTNSYGAATSTVATLTVNTASTNTGMMGYVTVGYIPTGGAGGTTQTVTTVAAFKTAVTSSAKMVIYVQGTLDVRSISSVSTIWMTAAVSIRIWNAIPSCKGGPSGRLPNNQFSSRIKCAMAFVFSGCSTFM